MKGTGMIRWIRAGLLIAGILLLWAAEVPAARIPSDAFIPRLRELGESFRNPLNAECREFHADYLEILDMYTEDVKGQFRLDKGHILNFENITSKFYGGTIQGQVQVTIAEQVTYRVELVFDNVDFRWFMMNVFDPGTEFKGKIRGELKLSGNDDGEVHGTLDLYLRDGFIGRLPRWFTTFTLISLNPVRATVINKGRINLTIEKDRFVVQECVMDGTDALIFGKGEIDFDGEADIMMNMMGKHKFASVFLPPLAALWKWVERGVVRISIKGPMLTPRYRIAPMFKL